jgi:hypothetical protein
MFPHVRGASTRRVRRNIARTKRREVRASHQGVPAPKEATEPGVPRHPYRGRSAPISVIPLQGFGILLGDFPEFLMRVTPGYNPSRRRRLPKR